MRKTSLISLGILVASLAGCVSAPNFPKRKDPEYSVNNWISKAECLGKFTNVYLESGVIFKGKHPEYKGVPLYVLALDGNSGGDIQLPSRGDQWRSSYDQDCLHDWKYLAPNAPSEQPPEIWGDEWKISKKTIDQVNAIYKTLRKAKKSTAVAEYKPNMAHK